MKKSDLNILIVDDDEIIRKVLSAAVEQEGFSAVCAKNAGQAESLVKIKSIHFAIVDCMLPGKNGLDLAVELKKSMPSSSSIALMSGIFRDKTYASDAIEKTGAIEFIYKPFDIDKIIELINSTLSAQISAPKGDLHILLSSPFASNRERKKALDQVENLSGFDLPFVFCILMDAKSSGHLNLVDEMGKIYGVTLVKGQICNVDSEDSDLIIERLLVKKGYSTQEDIDLMKERKGGLIKNLIAENLLSPHVLDLIKPDQMVKDLNYLIKDGSIKINFSQDRSLKVDGPKIDLASFVPQLHDMVDTSLTADWIKDFYSTWHGHGILEGPEFNENHQVFSMPLLQRIENIKEGLTIKPTIEEALSKLDITETNFYKALHLLMVLKVTVFSEDKKNLNVSGKAELIEKNFNDIKDLNPFEIFEFFKSGSSSKPHEVEKIYKEFAKNNHPDTLPIDIDQHIKDCNNRLFSLVSNAHDILVDQDKKSNYLRSMKQEEAHKQMKAESQAADAVNLLSRGNSKEAFEKVKEAKTLHQSDYVTLVYTWAYVKAHSNLPEDKIKNLLANLKTLSFESRQNEYFPFVNAILKKELRDYQGAKADLQKALSIRTDFMDARRELSSLKGTKGDKKMSASDILTGDISQVISNFFKKKG